MGGHLCNIGLFKCVGFRTLHYNQNRNGFGFRGLFHPLNCRTISVRVLNPRPVAKNFANHSVLQLTYCSTFLYRTGVDLKTLAAGNRRQLLKIVFLGCTTVLKTKRYRTVGTGRRAGVRPQKIQLSHNCKKWKVSIKLDVLSV